MTELRSEPFLVGEMARLRPLEEADYVVNVRRWLCDREVTRYLFRGALPFSEADARKVFQQVTANPQAEIELAVVRAADDTLVGITGLHGINWVARHAEFRILVGDRSAWGGGFGTEVCQMMAAYAFEILNLQKVWLGVTGENVRAYRSYLKTGFREEGRLRREIYRRGRYDDAVRMSLLREEYEAVRESWPVFPRLEQQLCDRS